MIAVPEDLNEELLRSVPDQGPVVMVNLVRFRERSLDGNGTGWDAYARYSKGDMPLLKKVGGTILWAGHIEATALGEIVDGRWDWVVLAQYPSKTAFLEMMTSPEYAVINKDRTNGVDRHVIMVANQTYSKFRVNDAT